MDLLLIIRGLAALSVVVWHAEGNHAEFPPVVNIPGRTAVWLFFGISGYVISYGFVHRRYKYTLHDLRDFYINRFLRIYPLFLLLSAVGWITLLLTSGTSPIGWRDLPAQLLAIQFDQNYILNGVFWTLGIELQFYLLAPLLAWMLLGRKSRCLIPCACLYGVMVYWNQCAADQWGWSFDGRNILANLSHFFMGMIACRLVAGGKPNMKLLFFALAGAAAAIAYSNWLYHCRSGWYWSVRGILLVDAAIFLFVVAHACCQRPKHSRNPVYLGFAFLGTLSYGIYAWHAYLMTHLIWLSTNVLALIGASIVAAYFSYRLVERPCLKLKRRHPEPHAPTVTE
ncbi:MAG: acyltransferase [Planctomycetes bacterium]|nr:acyltransferase [Planctomycetota bacterium]